MALATVRSTPFSLGVYVGNPDIADAANQATFDSNLTDFEQLVGTAPQYLTSFIDQQQSISNWAGNSYWAAESLAATPGGKALTPVIALPLSSEAAGSLSPDQSYQAFAAGSYDSVLKGIVSAWASQGYTNLVFRPGWEFNLQGPNYAGSTPQSQADWVSAFQHVYTVLHQAAAADGVNVQVMWNPSTVNYSNAEATAQLYPGDKYVDAIGADVYSDIYPYSDGGTTPTYHDWDTGKEDTSLSQFLADPINRVHYFNDPAATVYNNDSSDGHSLSLANLIQFAQEHGKTFDIPETGAGNSSGGQDVADDAAFPQWLAQQLTAAQDAGQAIGFVSLWDSNGGGNYEFSQASDDKPAEAAAWAQYFGAGAALSTTTPACYCAGTEIATPAGLVAVEDLAIGGLVTTASGEARVIEWIGRRSYAARFVARNPALRPIRFSAGSLGAGLPVRDLLVSGKHAMFLDGVLVPARELVNGLTIAPDRGSADVRYFHVELATHDVILAEGAACETFLDDDSRGIFHNAAEYRAMSLPTVRGGFCAPRLEHGFGLEAIRERLASVAPQKRLAGSF